MNRGFYLAATAMLIHERRLNSVSHNLANLRTQGFKREEMIVGTFNEVLSFRLDAQGKTLIGSTENLQAVSEIAHYFDQANITSTQKPLDFAIMGEGFFEVVSNGQRFYTRKGSFMIDAQGYLALQNGQRIQGENGDIFINHDRIVVNDYGMIFDQNGQFIDRINIVSTEDYSSLIKQPNGLFSSGVPLELMNTRLLQGSIEGSNVDMTQELTKMMEIQRNFQSVANALKLIDRLNERAANEIARI